MKELVATIFALSAYILIVEVQDLLLIQLYFTGLAIGTVIFLYKLWRLP